MSGLSVNILILTKIQHLQITGISNANHCNCRLNVIPAKVEAAVFRPTFQVADYSGKIGFVNFIN